MTRRSATALLPLGALALFYCLGQPIGSLAADAPPAPPTVTVSQPIQRELVEWDEYTGQFAAKEYVEVRARVSGYLTEIHFEDGQLVKEGDLLFVIDPRPYEATLAAARAQLAQGEAQVELATRQLGRTAELRKKDFEPASTYDQRVSDLKVATAAVESAKAAIRSAELNVGFTRITAPLTGRISNHQVSIGNLISGGDAATTPALTTIVSLDPIYFYFDMSEGDYLAYQRATAAGMLTEARDTTPPVYAHLTDETEWPWKGQLNFLDNQVDRGAGTIRARAIFSNPGYFLTPGQFGRIRIPASQQHTAILIPDGAVVTDQSRKVVMTVKDDGTVEPKVVRPGPMTEDGLRIIRSGLEPSDRVIINGLVRARPGGKVTPEPGQIETAARH
ncbi:MAG: efflux RND transporter periplasmic adaptor subunit [Stellaceae bacterium]|jgi:RND family efflux transporter MFP subunit